MFGSINFLPLIVAALVSMGLGSLWYSQVLFGKQWMKLSGAPQTKPTGKDFTIGFIGFLLAAYVLGGLIELTGTYSYSQGIVLAFMVWAGFVATSTVGSVIWERKSWKLFIINNTFNLIYLVLMSIFFIWLS